MYCDFWAIWAKVKTSAASFWVIYGKVWGTFYFNIWSHWL